MANTLTDLFGQEIVAEAMAAVLATVRLDAELRAAASLPDHFGASEEGPDSTPQGQ